MYVRINVYFTDNRRLIAGQLPYEVPVARVVLSSKERVASVLDEFFKGPSDVERNRGLTLVLNGFTGYSRLIFANGGAYVYLAGNCQSNGTLYTIARPLMANLKQFPEIQFVKIYDQLGHTQAPAARVDSLPACLDPTFIPSRTPLPTSTLSSTLKRTPTPLWTARPLFITRTPTKIYGPPSN
jgi:sporulation and spore germination protein